MLKTIAKKQIRKRIRINPDKDSEENSDKSGGGSEENSDRFRIKLRI